ncbi:hypothetical protein [Variovorax sp. WS11]|uniref:hypothetical protein n=1 Tax=Variovorax sp. WS11 TaxID=1105204 RepID=UPI0011B27D42|nr:hypothetical protein [Variovorax sp. WS11]NDZ17303.1 hypothetical protein [Variovorax sp. WS11]
MTDVSDKRELTTAEAAHDPNVSPVVIREIEAGRLPHRMVGTHRCITLDDLMANKQRTREGPECRFAAPVGQHQRTRFEPLTAGHAQRLREASELL